MKRFVSVFTAAIGCLALTASAEDWPAWRGPDQTGASREKAAVTSFSRDGENVLWHRDFGGRTTPIVFKGRVYFNCPVGEGPERKERVVCLDANTGETIWEYRFNVFLTDIVENRVGWTAVVVDPETGNVYCHGTGGEMFCFNRDGKILWKHSMTEEYGRISGYGGRLMTPIVDETRVIVSFLNSGWGSMAKGAHRYVAFAKKHGGVMYWSSPADTPQDTTYSTPVVSVVGGRRLLIAAAGDGNVYGMLARTGEPVWKYKLSKRGINASVVVDGNYAYVCHSEENLNNTKMGAIVCIDASKQGDVTDSATVWRLDGYPVGYASPAIASGRLYVVSNDADLFCIDAKTGKINWEYNIGRVGKGSPVVTADGVIYVGEQNGVFFILKDEGDECTVLDREAFDKVDGHVDEMFGSPAIANGRVYFMTRYNTYCLGVADAKVETVAGPPPRNEDAKPTEGTMGAVRIVPAEVTLHPGDKIEFKARHFGNDGAAGTPIKPDWSVAGIPGTIDKDGVLTVADDAGFAAGEVKASFVHGLVGTARIRTTPRLPIREDFESLAVGSTPPGWIGVNVKSKIVEQDGGKVLMKVASKERPSPPFMRMRAYATPPIERGYTVQADMKSERRDAGNRSYLPDMGLINARYRFIMLGKYQKLRIESWSPLPRLREDVDFDWKADTWYTVKFEIKHEGGKAICRAKVWPRDGEEPEAWTIQVEDPSPNTEGSAGLYCYSNGTTSNNDGPVTYFDNFKVYRNDADKPSSGDDQHATSKPSDDAK